MCIFLVEWLECNYIVVDGMSRFVVYCEFVENQEYGVLWNVVFEDGGWYWWVIYQILLGEGYVDIWFDDLEIIVIEVRLQVKFIIEWVLVCLYNGGRCIEKVVGLIGKVSICDLDVLFIIVMILGNEVELYE